jgi:hypothetical protein
LRRRTRAAARKAPADPESLGDFNLIGLSDVCHAIGVDWVTALLDD